MKNVILFLRGPLAQKMGDPRGEINALHAQGQLHLQVDALEQAITCLEKAECMAASIGDRNGLAACCYALGTAHQQSANFDRAAFYWLKNLHQWDDLGGTGQIDVVLGRLN